MKLPKNKSRCFKRDRKMAKTCTFRKRDLSTLRSLMLKSRQVEMNTSYLRYPKFQVIEEFSMAVQEYKKFISHYLMLYTDEEKHFIQKMENYSKKYPIKMNQIKKVSFQLFHHIADKYRLFQLYLDL
jgi:hypothetical protein